MALPKYDTIPPELCTGVEAAAILGYKNRLTAYTANRRGLSYTYAIVNNYRIALYNRAEVQAMAPPSIPEGFIPYRELFRIISEGRVKCGMPPYKWHSSLHSRLKHYHIPTFRISENEVLYHKETALRLILPELALEEATEKDITDIWVDVKTVFKHANKLRQSVRLAPLKSTNSICNVLHYKKVPYRAKQNQKRNRLYNLEAALRALTQFSRPHQKPVHRNLTASELKSGDYMPLTEAAQLLNCHHIRLQNAAMHLNIRARRHPHTNRIWVHFEDAQRIAWYRQASFLFAHLSIEKAQQVIATRPSIITMEDDCGFRKKAYFCPELSHIGGKNTTVRKKSRGVYPEIIKK